MQSHFLSQFPAIYISVEVLPNQQEATIKNKLRAVIHLYEQRGFQVTSIMADPEFEPLWAVFPQLNTCGAH